MMQITFQKNQTYKALISADAFKHKLEQLQAEIDGDVDFSDSGRALYAVDASNYRQVPLGVVVPKTRADMITIVTFCRDHQLPLLPRGGGTSQNGQCVNVAVVMDCSQYLTDIQIDADSKTAVIEPGVVCDALKAAAAPHGLTFGPDPATHSRCTLGGMIGNNSCGPHSMLAGKTVENIEALEVLTYSGEKFWVGETSEAELEEIIQAGGVKAKLYRELKAIRDDYAELIRSKYPKLKRRVSGYNVDQLLPEHNFHVARALVGSEGTLVTTLRAKVRLIQTPKLVQTWVVGFRSIYEAGDAVKDILPFKPIAMEGLDMGIVGGLKARRLMQEEIALLPEGEAWLMIELAAETEQALCANGQVFADHLASMPIVQSYQQVEGEQIPQLWRIREQGASATSMSLDPRERDPIVGWEDTAVEPTQIGNYLREFQALVDRYGYTTNLYGHFGDGCIHARITFDTRSESGVKHWQSFSQEISQLVIKYGGSLSGEHGDGQAKAEFLPLMFGEDMMHAFRRFKRAWDPDHLMNPNKLIHPEPQHRPYHMAENLRFGPDYQLPVTQTTLTFSQDHGGFARATERCIGMGKCRSQHTAMCPSYQATGVEAYSTRGRAHLLHELLRGEAITDGWRNETVKEALEHCLSCKSCLSDCPTQVDIASYKAEFMAQHHANQRRSVDQVFFAKIGQLLPALAKFSSLVNFGSKLNIGKKLTQSLLKLDPDYQAPTIAKTTFLQSIKQQADFEDADFYWRGSSANPATVLWVDTFNNHYQPQILTSIVEVLLAQSFKVGIAKQRYCCGRTLYEAGYLQAAKAQMMAILDGFHASLPKQVAVIVAEPACLSVFQDEANKIVAADALPDVHALQARLLTLPAFLQQQGIQPNRQLKRGILQLHCHQKALAGAAQERAFLAQCFERLDEPEPGCCGMAGSYGAKAKTRDISKQIYQNRLGPAVEASDSDTTIVATGFSCREQVQQLSDKQAVHPVEVIKRCL